ncbi:MAG: (Fe-S)-binding protein [Dehalococcoidia bacterium]|nr:(Fe-S)-binding protein [Dehalococcoidia bacterium]MDH4299674.1 (Fe-S)-binding protein [Dehalococcoidia bacterium]MDH4366518.1 (Fe-S)-binding protein [Dehalococcoidia bacterium]
MAEDKKETEKIGRCAMCADMCKYSCPTYLATGRETLSPQKMARLIVYHEKGLLEDRKDFLDLMFQSALCGACSRHCIYDDYDLRRFIHKARVKAFESGAIPEDVKKRVETFRKFGNPNGERKPIDKGAGDIGYFISCSSYKDEDLLRATEKMLSKSGLAIRRFGGGDMCCGAPLYYAGDMEGFKRASLKMKAEVDTKQVGKIVIDCPTCVKTMTETYRDMWVELDVEIMHTAQFIETLLKQGKLGIKKKKRTVTLHDPCILSYDLALSSAPREIIATLGFSLKEPVYSGDQTHCCGAAYGAKIGDHRLKDAVTSRRLNELRSTAADIYVTACPTCKSVLSEINMKYITELVAERVIAKR